MIQAKTNQNEFKHMITKENNMYCVQCLLTKRIEYLFDSWEEYSNIFLDTNFVEGICGFMKKIDHNYTTIDYAEYREGKDFFFDWIEKKRVII